ncbi:MAG: major capsid protein [Magnetospirillum sp. WYHS-4]
MPNLEQVRVVDPILTTQARGYTNGQAAGIYLFPYTGVPKRAGKRLEFGKESFQLYNSKRAPGAATKRVNFGYEGEKFSLEQSSLEGQVPREHLEEAPGIDMAGSAVRVVQGSISLEQEVDQATKARDAANYDANHKVALAGTSRWNDPDSDPKAIVKAGKAAIRLSAGRDPNTMVLGPKVFDALDDHPKLLEKLKYTSSDSLTEAMLAKYFGVDRVVVGKMVYWDPVAGIFVEVWGRDAVLAWVPPAGESNWMVPSFGYTYRLNGMPVVEQTYYDNNAKSWIYPYTDEWSAEMVGADAGFLIQTVVDE